jgi:hypothetical protein
MTALAICDLPQARALSGRVLSTIRGAAGAPWVYGWIRPYTPPSPVGPFPAMNFYQINNNFFHADQVNNQFQTIEINNTAVSANITAVLIAAQTVA